jgi:hypothetical protein
MLFFADYIQLLQQKPYQGISSRLSRLKNSRTSSSQQEMYRWPCATGLGRSSVTGHV